MMSVIFFVFVMGFGWHYLIILSIGRWRRRAGTTRLTSHLLSEYYIRLLSIYGEISDIQPRTNFLIV